MIVRMKLETGADEAGVLLLMDFKKPMTKDGRFYPNLRPAIKL